MTVSYIFSSSVSNTVGILPPTSAA